jgi:hypothetical protein
MAYLLKKLPGNDTKSGGIITVWGKFLDILSVNKGLSHISNSAFATAPYLLFIVI